AAIGSLSMAQADKVCVIFSRKVLDAPDDTRVMALGSGDRITEALLRPDGREVAILTYRGEGAQRLAAGGGSGGGGGGEWWRRAALRRRRPAPCRRWPRCLARRCARPSCAPPRRGGGSIRSRAVPGSRVRRRRAPRLPPRIMSACCSRAKRPIPRAASPAPM